jgi:hypothetical protein
MLRDIFVTGGGLSRLPADTQKAALLMTERLTRHAEGQLALARVSHFFIIYAFDGFFKSAFSSIFPRCYFYFFSLLFSDC